MKRLILTIITLSIITLNGCYDPDTATVRINLGNMPLAKHEPVSLIDRIMGLFVKDAWAQTIPAGVTKVHIAAYKESTTLLAETYNAGDLKPVYGPSESTVTYIDITAPAGNDITFLVIGSDGTSALFCASVKQNIKAGIVNTVTLSCNQEYLWVEGLVSQMNMHYDTSKQMLKWDGVGIAASYIVRESNEEIVYQGSGNGFSVEQYPCGTRSFNLYMLIEPFNIRSQTDISCTVDGLGMCK